MSIQGITLAKTDENFSAESSSDFQSYGTNPDNYQLERHIIGEIGGGFGELWIESLEDDNVPDHEDLQEGYRVCYRVKSRGEEEPLSASEFEEIPEYVPAELRSFTSETRAEEFVEFITQDPEILIEKIAT